MLKRRGQHWSLRHTVVLQSLGRQWRASAAESTQRSVAMTSHPCNTRYAARDWVTLSSQETRTSKKMGFLFLPVVLFAVLESTSSAINSASPNKSIYLSYTLWHFETKHFRKKKRFLTKKNRSFFIMHGKRNDSLRNKHSYACDLVREWRSWGKTAQPNASQPFLHCVREIRQFRELHGTRTMPRPSAR